MLAWLAVVSIALVVFVRDEIRRQHLHPSLTEARKQGEGQHVEFKRSFLWNHERNSAEEQLRMKVLRTIVAFLNSGGGTLFVGVQDDGQPWGLAEDLQCCDGSEDKLHQRLRNLIADLIGAQFAHDITSRIDDDPDYPAHRVLFVGVGAAPEAAFLQVSSRSHFYVRSGPETRELDMLEFVQYCRSAQLRI
jgi:predicted HTH transcriptional regulator